MAVLRRCAETAIEEGTVGRFGLVLILAGIGVLVLGCSSGTKQRQASPSRTAPPSTFTPGAATFTPAPSTPAAGATQRPVPAQPVVAASCLRGLSSYRFSGKLSVKAAASTPGPAAAAGSATPASEAGSSLAGSLANLLSNVTFTGAARAPDRTEATITFAGAAATEANGNTSTGPPPLQLVQIGKQTWSRFGSAAWQQGNEVAGLGNIVQFDPETICEQTLAQLSASGQTPVHQTINGIPSLHYQFNGEQYARLLFGGGSGNGSEPTVTPTPPAGNFSLALWTAAKGAYPVRVQFQGGQKGSSFSLLLNVSDVNGKDIVIQAPR